MNINEEKHYLIGCEKTVGYVQRQCGMSSGALSFKGTWPFRSGLFAQVG